MPTKSFLSWLSDHRGRALDLLTFLANLTLLGTLSSELGEVDRPEANDGEVMDPRLRYVVVAAIAAYTLGAALKRAPLHARVAALPAPGHSGCLFVAWFILHVVLFVFAGAAIVAHPGAKNDVLAVTIMSLIVVLPTAFAARVLFRPRRLEMLPAWRRSFAVELLADVLIGAAALTSTWVWNEGISGAVIWDDPGAPVSNKIFSAVVTTGAFAMFYAAPRFLFLIEDHHRWSTWFTMALTVTPLIARILIA